MDADSSGRQPVVITPFRKRAEKRPGTPSGRIRAPPIKRCENCFQRDGRENSQCSDFEQERRGLVEFTAVLMIGNDLENEPGRDRNQNKSQRPKFRAAKRVKKGNPSPAASLSGLVCAFARRRGGCSQGHIA